MAASEGLILGRLLCQQGRRALKPPDCLTQSLSLRTLGGWRQKYQSSSEDNLSGEPSPSLQSCNSLGAPKEDDLTETDVQPGSNTSAAWVASQLRPTPSTAGSLDLPYTVRWPSAKLASSLSVGSDATQCIYTGPGLYKRPSAKRSLGGSLNTVHWMSTKPDSDEAALGAEYQGVVEEAMKTDHGERLQKETSASEAAACDEAVNTLSEAQKKAKQKEAAKKDRTLTQQAIAFIVGIPSALRAVFAMSGADWVRTFKGWGVAIKETAQHYWVGTKLLWADVRVASRLLLKVANGKSLSRRERKQLTRTVADVFRLVPFAIFVIVPFMEFLLPVFLRFFPNMLPSTFQDKMKEEELMKKKLQARLQYARFLQETVGEMAREVKSTSTGDKKKTAEDLVAFMQKVRTGRHVSNDDIVNFAKLFNDELTLDNISRPRLVSMCKYMGLSPFGTDAYLRYQLRARLNWIKQDDKMIQREGVDSLTEKELRSACRQRGMLSVDNMSEDEMRTEIREWLDLSLNRSLPSSLLILSRAFKVSPTSSPDDALQAALSSLPDEVVDELGMTELGDEDTLAQRTRKLQYLKRQEELIKAEEAREQKDEEAEQKKKEAEKQAARDVALEEMKTATAKGLGFDTEGEAPLAHKVARAKAIDQREELCQLSEALAVLASASSVSKERTDFLSMVNKEISMYNAMVEKEGTDGAEEAKRLFFEAKKEVDRAAHEQEEGDGGTGASQALIKRVDSLLHKLEKEIDDVDAKIGDRWRILDRDYDGKVSPDELAAAAAFLKSELGEEPVQQLIANLAKDKDGKILVEDIVKLGTMTTSSEAHKQQETSSG